MSEEPKWKDYEKLVLHRLDTIDRDLLELKHMNIEKHKDLLYIREELARLKAQARSWGAMAGFVTAAIVSLGLEKFIL